VVVIDEVDMDNWGIGGETVTAARSREVEHLTKPDDAAMKPAGCTARKGPQATWFVVQGPDAAGRPDGFIPPGGGFVRRSQPRSLCKRARPRILRIRSIRALAGARQDGHLTR